MKMPYHVLELDADQLEQWNEHFDGDGHDRPRYVEEGIWRRTQDPANAAQSGWSQDSAGRRRIVHYWYRYGVVETSLLLRDFYLYYCVTYPDAEIARYSEMLEQWLGDGHWVKTDEGRWRRGDLAVRIDEHEFHPQDRSAGRDTPVGHRSLEVCITSVDCRPADGVVGHPWKVLSGGMRVKDHRGEPTVIADLSKLVDYLPFQVEVGCGTSVEAGVPPLHRLHEIYRVTKRRDNNPGAGDEFVLNVDDDTLLKEVLCSPERKFLDFVEMYKKCFLAPVTPALDALRQMVDMGHIAGPVITNNFDVLTARAGLDECFVRRYDQKIPDVPLLPEAQALLVVGNHADRRKVEARAREAGMKVFYLDPEGFWNDGEFAPYPLEGALSGDYLCRKTAAEGLPELAKILSDL